MGACIANEYYLYLDSSKTTKSTQELGPKPALEYIVLQRKYLVPIIKKFRGQVIDIEWDSLMAVFHDPYDAIFAGDEIKDVYNTNPEFLQIQKSAKIALSALSISQNTHICEEVGENVAENGDFVIHGERLIKSLGETIHLYGFEFGKFEVAKFKEDKFALITKSGMKGVQSLDNKYILTYAPMSLGGDWTNEFFAKHKGYKYAWLKNFLWIFDEKQNALNAAIELYDRFDGKITVSLNFGETSLVHENLQILSSFGVNLACKLAQDTGSDKTTIRITKTTFAECPKDGFSLKNTDLGGMKVDFWEFEKKN